MKNLLFFIAIITILLNPIFSFSNQIERTQDSIVRLLDDGGKVVIYGITDGKPNFLKKQYDANGRLRVIIEDVPHLKRKNRLFPVKYIFFYEDGVVAKEYMHQALISERPIGQFLDYYPSGNLKAIGFYNITESYLHMRDKTWTWYDEDGNVEHYEKYKLVVEKLNGYKRITNYYFDGDVDRWVKHGYLEEIKDNREVLNRKQYSFGEEIEFELPSYYAQ